MVDHINNGEEGYSVREKLNTVIDRTNTLNGIENQVEANNSLGQQNAARIDQEIANRIDADQALQEQIDGISTEIGEFDVAILNNKINQEIIDRADGDSALQEQIDGLSGGLSQEIIDRQEADSALSDQITSGDNALSGEISSLESTLTDAITSGDSALQGQIDNIVSFPEAPVDGSQYARQDGAWSAIVIPEGVAPHTHSGDDISGGTITDFASTGIDDNADALAITIDSSEKVGIGTDAPSAKLHVDGNVIAKTQTYTTNADWVTLDYSTFQNFVVTLSRNITLGNPSTEVKGQSGFIVFIQDATGGRTVSTASDYETASAAGLTLSSEGGATDIVPYVVVAENRILLGAPQLAFS